MKKFLFISAALFAVPVVLSLLSTKIKAEGLYQYQSFISEDNPLNKNDYANDSFYGSLIDSKDGGIVGVGSSEIGVLSSYSIPIVVKYSDMLRDIDFGNFGVVALDNLRGTATDIIEIGDYYYVIGNMSESGSVSYVVMTKLNKDGSIDRNFGLYSNGYFDLSALTNRYPFDLNPYDVVYASHDSDSINILVRQSRDIIGGTSSDLYYLEIDFNGSLVYENVMPDLQNVDHYFFWQGKIFVSDKSDNITSYNIDGTINTAFGTNGVLNIESIINGRLYSIGDFYSINSAVKGNNLVIGAFGAGVQAFFEIDSLGNIVFNNTEGITLITDIETCKIYDGRYSIAVVPNDPTKLICAGDNVSVIDLTKYNGNVTANGTFVKNPQKDLWFSNVSIEFIDKDTFIVLGTDRDQELTIKKYDVVDVGVYKSNQWTSLSYINPEVIVTVYNWTDETTSVVSIESAGFLNDEIKVINDNCKNIVLQPKSTCTFTLTYGSSVNGFGTYDILVGFEGGKYVKSVNIETFFEDIDTAYDVQRFFNVRLGSAHFYTIRADEAQTVELNSEPGGMWPGAFVKEQPTFKAFIYDANLNKCKEGTSPVYRYLNRDTGDTHFYAIEQSEIDAMSNQFSATFKPEGVAFCAYKTLIPGTNAPVYRWLNKKLGSTHFYTSWGSEKYYVDTQLKDTFVFEKEAFYAIPVPEVAN